MALGSTCLGRGTKDEPKCFGRDMHLHKVPLVCMAHSEGHPHKEGTFTGTLVNVRDLRQNPGECQGGSPEYGVVGSPKTLL